MMVFNSVRRHLSLRALLFSCGLVAGTPAIAQDLSVPADPVAAIEGDWNGIWEDWSVAVTNGRVVLTKGDPKTYSWLPVGTVLGVLNNNGKSEARLFRFSGSTCLDYPRDKSPSEYQTIPCGDFGAVLTVFADSYELKVSGISLRRPKNATQSISTKVDTAKPTSDAPPKFIEVAGPDGPIRLSPEVAARNQAAADEYRRKMEAHARHKTDHDRKMAEYEESIARAGRALRDHEALLRAQQVEHQKQLREHAARVEERDSDTPCARYRRSNGAGWKVNPCV